MLSLQLDGDAVVDGAEHDRAQQQRHHGCDREIKTTSATSREMTRPERVAHREDRRRDRVPPAQHVEQRVNADFALSATSSPTRGSASGRTTAEALR